MKELPELEKIEELLGGGTGPRWLTARELAAELGLEAASRPALRRALQRWADEGALLRLRGRRYGSTRSLGTLVGRLTRLPAGYGFVAPDDPRESDVFVPAENQADALHGDVVAVRVIEVRPDGRRSGRIERVIERRSSRLVGLFHRTYSGGGLVEPLDAGFGFEVIVDRRRTSGAESGELVRIEVERFPSETAAARGFVIERLGRPDEPGVDVEVLIRKYGFETAFPEAVEQAATSLAGDPESWPLEGREDFTVKTVVTIDGETAQDFDDAICVEREGEDFLLHVLIADVAHFVEEGGAIDREALRRGTSVYFPGRSIPMLPERLSHDLCSLRPERLRLAQGVTLRYGPAGERKQVRLHQGFLRSTARLTYTDVARWQESGARKMEGQPPEVAGMLRAALRLAELLSRRRESRGAVDFDLPEPEILLDLTGATVGIEARSRNAAHRLIEEFMIAANEAVAEKLLEARRAAIYRVHERPPADRAEKLAAALDALGYGLPRRRGGRLEPSDLAAVVARARGREEETLVQRLVLRSMALARYEADCLGHFGLALERYLHFTSPIRRYPDLVVHRAVRRLLEGRAGAGGEREERRARMPELAEECSRLERDAEAAERESIAWKKAAYMAERLGEEFDGHVVDVAPHGVTVLIREPYVEGLLPVARLGREYFRYDERRRRLVGGDSGAVFRIGAPVRVRVDRVDLLRHFIDFALVGESGRGSSRRQAPAGRGRRKVARRRKKGRRRR